MSLRNIFTVSQLLLFVSHMFSISVFKWKLDEKVIDCKNNNDDIMVLNKTVINYNNSTNNIGIIYYYGNSVFLVI